MTQTIRLVGPPQRERAKALIDKAPDGWIVEFKEKVRTSPQNRKFHAMVKDLIEQEPEGRKLDMREWKALLMDLASRMAGDSSPFVSTYQPSLDGNGFTLVPPRSSNLRVAEFNSLIDAAYLYGAQEGVVWSEKYHIDA